MEESLQERSALKAFPSGLEQPEGSFRFSSDALHLAELAAGLPLPEEAVFADLGTGCGVAALAVLLKRARWRAVGLDIMPELVGAAGRNALSLGLEGRFTVMQGDIVLRTALRAARSVLLAEGVVPAASLPLFDAVICNPPWRREGAGRMPSSILRRTALFGTELTFRNFFRAGDALLKNGGYLVCVSGADRTAELLAALPGRMRPEYLRFVFTKKSGPAAFVLLQARKNGRGTLKVERLEAL